MPDFLRYDEQHPSRLIFALMTIFAAILIVFGFCQDTPQNIISGLVTITRTPAGLISDSMVVGGMGAAFVNSGLVLLISLFLLWRCKLYLSGISIACLFLMAGFALFGKDVLNIFPIIAGSYLYAKYKKQPFGRYIYFSFFGTALSPMVTEMAQIGISSTLWQSIVSVALGMLIGFVLPSVSAFTMRVHQGYNLYNVGFAAGLVGMVITSLFRSLGHSFVDKLLWSTGNNLRLSVFLFSLFGLMVLGGFLYNKRSFEGFWPIMRHTGRSVADFIRLDGLPVTLMNMGVMGAAATAYVLLVGGDLNGPTIGGIMTICGFGAFGKHLKNCVPVVLGVVVSSFFMVWKLDDPSVMLAALFATGIAPIAGQFGFGWGMVAGIIHSSVVLNVGTLHGGLNLYNNGFSVGLVCIVLVPFLESLQRDKEEE